MANNPLRIKRSTGNASPASLSDGEPAYSNTSQTLWIGMSGGPYRIGGLQVPGTLTANQALVANSTSGINNIITANLSVSGSITANGALGGIGNYLTSNSTGGVYWSAPGAASVNSQAQYTWTNTHIFQANVTITGNSTAEFLIASLGAAAAIGGSVANQTGFYSGNSTVNTSWTYTALTVGSSVVGNATITEGTLGAAAAVGGAQINTTAIAQGNSTVNTSWTYTALTLGSSVVGNASITEGTLGAAAAVGGVQINTTSVALGNSTVNSVIGYSTYTSGTSVINATAVASGANIYMTTTAHFAGNATVNSVLSSTSLQFSGGNTVNNTIYTGQASTVANGGVSVIPNLGIVSNTTGIGVIAGNGIAITAGGVNVNPNTGIIANSTGTFVNPTLSLTNLTLTGNLTVQGTVTTIDTTTLSVKDNMIVLADQEASTGTFTDNIDTGFYVQTGNTTVNFYSGLSRVAASSSNTVPFFKLFSTATLPNNTIIDTSATLGQLNAYLIGGALVSNSTNFNITGTGSLAVAIAANTLTLSTAMGVASGGTGATTLANNAVLVGNAAGTFQTIALGTTGFVLQSNGTSVVYDVIDGGTF